MSNLAAFVIRRMIAMVIILFIVVTAVFFLAHSSPYDPFKILLGQRATVTNVAKLRQHYGFDGGTWVQYQRYLGGLLHGSLGISVGNGSVGVPVTTILQQRLPVSLKLGAWSLVLALLFGLPIGLLSALRQNSIFDHAGQGVTMLFYVVPAFVICPLCQLIFGVALHWLPVQGWGDTGWWGPLGLIPNGPLGLNNQSTLDEMILPVLIFASGLAGFFAKSFRSFMLEQLRQDYIRTARAKGLKNRVVIYLHAVKNTLLPLFSIIGPTIALLVTGAFIIEIFFAIPGIGFQTAQSVINSDYNVIEGTTVVLVVAVVVVNMLTDISYAMVDPRVRL